MAEQQYYLCFEEYLNEEEFDLICKYWEVKEVDKEGGTLDFRYKVTELESMFGVKRVSLFVKNHAFIVSNSEKGVCPNCGKKLRAKVRLDFIKVSKVRRLPCNDCQRTSINSEALEKIQIVKAEMQVGLYQAEFSMAELDSLSYIDTLVLLIIILDISSLDEFPIQLEREEFNLLGSDDLDEKYLRKLASKNAIKLVNDNEYTQVGSPREIEHFLERNSEFVNADTLELYVELQGQTIEPGIYCNVPSNFKNFNEYKEYLFDKVIDAKIDHKDIESIRDLVVNNRLELAYSLVAVVKNYWNIPVNMSVKLDSVLQTSVINYPIPVAHNMFNYRAEKVAAKIQATLEMPSYIKDKLFAKQVEWHIKQLEKIDKPYFVRRLPDYMVSSKIEDFTSYYVMGGLMSWTDLSADEVVARWLNSSTIQIKG